MNTKIIFRKCIEDNIKIHPHCNNPYCSQKIIEVNPTLGCEFQCQYCCVYTQEKECYFNKIIVYEDYYQLLEDFIINNKDKLNNLIFFYSFESDCFQDILSSSGISVKILKLFKKYDIKYFLLTKGKISNDSIMKLLLETKHNLQIIVNDTMPDENMKQILEPYAANVVERYNLVKYFLEKGIYVTISFSPILPFIHIDYLKKKIDKYIKLGIIHFRLDMLELSEYNLNRLMLLLPDYNDKLYELYLSDNRAENKWISPISQNIILRYKPSEKFIAKIYKDIDNYVKNINYEVTVSICDGIVANNSYLKDFNKRSYNNGFNCMGYKFN